jgi:GH35 family endo-1,4-beta-xylanase
MKTRLNFKNCSIPFLHRSLRIILLMLIPGVSVQQIGAQPDTGWTRDKIMQTAAENVEQYRKSDASVQFVDQNGNPMAGMQVEVIQETQDFLFGAILFDLVWDREMTPEREKLLKERFAGLFNMAILPFYWGSYEAIPGHPRWDLIEPALTWCLEQGMTCKGHPLGWTHQVGIPDEILDLSLEDAEMMLHARIIENVIGFRDRITLWDVVNEPVNTVSWELGHQDRSKEHRYGREIPVAELTGWVDRAYKTAYRANPDNQYILNEFRQIADPVVRQRFHDFTEELLEKETPIHGLGLQAHEPRDEWYDPVDVWETLELYAQFGLPLHITEFSPQSAGAPITGGYREGSWTPETQAEFTEEMYRIWFGHPSVVSINWWGISDANSWLPGAGFLDEDLGSKPAYEVLKKLITEEWRTRDMQLRTDRNGTIRFRGFHGKYRLVATSPDGTSKRHEIHLTREGATEWVLERE